MRIVKAVRGVYIPHDPEKPDVTQMRLLTPGVIAIVPDAKSFDLPEDYIKDLGKIEVKKLKKDDNQE